MKITKFIAILAVFALILGVSQSDVFAVNVDLSPEDIRAGVNADGGTESDQDGPSQVAGAPDTSDELGQDGEAGVHSDSSTELDQDSNPSISEDTQDPQRRNSNNRRTGTSGSTLVSAASGNLPASCPLITSYLRLGQVNDFSQVTKLQSFLKNIEKIDVEVTGTFDVKTDAAVRAFQERHLAAILGPWDATLPTGYVYITTTKMINQIACDAAFALTAGEQAIIDAYKQSANSAQVDEVGSDDTTPGSLDVGSADEESNVAAVGGASVLSRFWNFIKNLFR